MTKYYFTEDGSWGWTEGMVLVDDSDVDPHLFEVVDGCLDSERSAFAEWFTSHDHTPVRTDNQYGISNGLCGVCDEWED